MSGFPLDIQMEKIVCKLGTGKLGISHSGIFLKGFPSYNTAGKAVSKKNKGPSVSSILFLSKW